MTNEDASQKIQIEPLAEGHPVSLHSYFALY